MVAVAPLSLAGMPATMIGHLIHIGYAKAGSTFLRSWFAQHPQLVLCGGRDRGPSRRLFHGAGSRLAGRPAALIA